jgi:hypothetical protein
MDLIDKIDEVYSHRIEVLYLSLYIAISELEERSKGSALETDLFPALCPEYPGITLVLGIWSSESPVTTLPWRRCMRQY